MLPEVDDYSPQSFDPDDADTEPVPPLARATRVGRGRAGPGRRPEQRYRRETNTMPQWAGSCWYELRYLDPTNDKTFVDPEVERVLAGQGPGPARRPRRGRPVRRRRRARGAAPAVLPVLAQGAVRPGPRQLARSRSAGCSTRATSRPTPTPTSAASYVPAEEVVEAADGTGFTWNGQPVRREYGKMGKSLNNVVTPDEMCERYGADTFRLYEMSTWARWTSPGPGRPGTSSARSASCSGSGAPGRRADRADPGHRRRAGRRDAARCCTDHRRRARATSWRCTTTRRSPS